MAFLIVLVVLLPSLSQTATITNLSAVAMPPLSTTVSARPVEQPRRLDGRYFDYDLSTPSYDGDLGSRVWGNSMKQTPGFGYNYEATPTSYNGYLRPGTNKPHEHVDSHVNPENKRFTEGFGDDSYGLSTYSVNFAPDDNNDNDYDNKDYSDDDNGNVDNDEVGDDGYPDYDPDFNRLKRQRKKRPRPLYGPPNNIPVFYQIKPKYKGNDVYSQLGLIAILKLFVTKLNTFWFIKLGLLFLFLVKVPFITTKLMVAFLFFVKFLKFIKIIAIPSLIPLLVFPMIRFVLLLFPLLLLPLAPLLIVPFLLPLMLPVLLMLPIPPIARPGSVLSYFTTTTTDGTKVTVTSGPSRPTTIASTTEMSEGGRRGKRRGKGKRKRKRKKKGNGKGEEGERDGGDRERGRGIPAASIEDLLILTKTVMESERCMEKLACEIGGSQTPRVYSGPIVWLLQWLQTIAPQTILSRLQAYTLAFQMGTVREQQCSSEYQCSTPAIFADRMNLLF